MKEEDIKELLIRYNSGLCTEEEKAVLESWYLQIKGRDFDLNDKELELLKNSSWQNIVNQLRSQKNKRKTFSWIPYAAVFLVIVSLSTSLFLLFNDKPYQDLTSVHENIIENDLIPGGNKATLTLADGNVISLNESANGIIAQVEGMKISKTSDGQIVYSITNRMSLKKEGESTIKYNRISTPRGGQYQIVLPDGTKVWLNAASSLKYPEYFDGNGRNVELLGEAYFEVNSQKSTLGENIPFLVSTATQTLEVLGTHFNINSYEDEGAVRTTLLEGSVRVSSNSNDRNKTGEISLVLKPNQQSVLSGKDFNVVNVNAEESVAWKNGYFSFEQASIETVMRQLSRWYDVEIVYNGNIPKGTFTGKVYRDMNISKVLEILAFAQVDFKIEGKRMIIFS